MISEENSAVPAIIVTDADQVQQMFMPKVTYTWYATQPHANYWEVHIK